jgi:hypothetical protein
VEVVPMYGLTRGALTLIGAATAGVLLWLGASLVPDDEFFSIGDYWSTAGLVAAAGLTMALSQLLGGWTKWGWPRVSGNVFLMAFLPVLIVGGWILAAAEPGDHWLGSHVRNWSEDLGIRGLIGDLTLMFPAIAFGIGLVFGFTFDTTGPRIPKKAKPVAAIVPTPKPESEPVTATDGEPKAVETGGGTGDDRRVHIREGEATTTTPEAERPSRTGDTAES